MLQNVIQSDRFSRTALTSAGDFYKVDTNHTFKYELVASDVYLLMGNGYYTNNGLFYKLDYNRNIYLLFLKDVALPQIKP